MCVTGYTLKQELCFVRGRHFSSCVDRKIRIAFHFKHIDRFVDLQHTIFIKKILKSMDTLSREATLPFSFFLPFLKGFTLKRKNLLLRSKFFLLKVDPLLKGLRHAGKETECHKSFSPV